MENINDKRIMTNSNNQAIKKIALLSLCHMGIDFLCAFSLYHSFKDLYQTFLIYNFCAFALQMPFGIIIDYFNKTKKSIDINKLFTVMGVIFTIIGSYFSYIILGIGNALFHVGGGVITINEDSNNNYDGRGLGVFVAPGAIGLILGSLFYNTINYEIIHTIVSILVLIIACILYLTSNTKQQVLSEHNIDNNKLISVIVSCFLVVVLRSLTGMAISFSWKQGTILTIISVICLALGKTIGGFLAAKFNMKKVIVTTLIISTIAYYFSNNLYFGLIALLFFNMTMPITLYLLYLNMPAMPGFAFGILTFGLFIGYLPVLFGYLRNMNPFPLGSISSLISIFLLYYVCYVVRNNNE